MQEAALETVPDKSSVFGLGPVTIRFSGRVDVSLAIDLKLR